jgi:hypothetical protein
MSTIHIVPGKPRTSGKRKRPAAVVSYQPGHFTKGISEWLKGWKPTDWAIKGQRPAHELTADAQRGVEMGKAFGGRVTMDLPNTPHGNLRPGTLKKAQA